MLKEIIKKYFPEHRIESVKPIYGGHINDTYQLNIEGIDQSYIIQRINTHIFKDPYSIAETHRRLQEVIPEKGDLYTIARIIPDAGGSYISVDEKGGTWRMTSFIEGTHMINVVKESWQAREAGKAFGWFASVCSQLKVQNFKEAIVNFHSLSFRLNQLKEAMDVDPANRTKKVTDIIDFYIRRESELTKIENLIDEGKIPLRLVHNDTKINNLLFRDNKAMAVIDLDTVGPGSVYYDYGDALRTSANFALEDEQDFSKAGFNMQAFISFTEGYLSQIQPFIAPAELKYLHLAPKFMTFIMGIRFLTDYLNGDRYYKTGYPDHNLTRCMVQLKLIESMESHETEMSSIIEEKYYQS